MKVRDPFHLYTLASLRIRIGMKSAWREATSPARSSPWPPGIHEHAPRVGLRVSDDSKLSDLKTLEQRKFQTLMSPLLD